jgi:hypothetical protein
LQIHWLGVVAGVYWPEARKRIHRWQRRWTLALLIVLALIVALFIGLGFVVKWLFIIAAIAALIWLIAFFTGRARA